MNVEVYFETCWIFDDKNKATLVIKLRVFTVESIAAINIYGKKSHTQSYGGGVPTCALHSIKHKPYVNLVDKLVIDCRSNQITVLLNGGGRARRWTRCIFITVFFSFLLWFVLILNRLAYFMTGLCALWRRILSCDSKCQNGCVNNDHKEKIQFSIF